VTPGPSRPGRESLRAAVLRPGPRPTPAARRWRRRRTPFRPATRSPRDRAADIEVLQRVDVGHDSREEVAAAVALELCRRQRLEPLVGVHTDSDRAHATRRRATRAARSTEHRRPSPKKRTATIAT
jgi:hypothetical protein